MKYTLLNNTRNEFFAELGKLGNEKCWFNFVRHFSDFEFFSVNCLTNEKIEHVGCGVLKKSNSNLDCSFFIFSAYRNKSIAKQFVRHMINDYPQIQFTVSLFNVPSLALFDSVNELRIHKVNDNKKTIIYVKRKLGDLSNEENKSEN